MINFYRNRTGKIIRAAPFQKTLTSGTQARVAPNRKWFGKTTRQQSLSAHQSDQNAGKHF